jgi:hypothetical protein
MRTPLKMDYISSTRDEIERTINDRVKAIYGYDVQFVYSYSGSYSSHTSITVRVLFKIHGVTFLFLKKKHQFKLIDDDEIIRYIWNAITNEMLEYHKYNVEWTDSNSIIRKMPFIAKDHDDLNLKFMFGSKRTGDISLISATLIY